MPSSDRLNNNGGTDADVEELETQIGNAYNDVNLSGAGTDLEFFTPNGGTTAVKSITLPSGGGGGATFEAFNSITESNNIYTFHTNYGNTVGTTIDIGGIATNTGSISSLSSTVNDIKNLTGTSTLKTTVTGLNTTVNGHTTAIDDLEAREQFKVITRHPDLLDTDMTSSNPIVNGRSYSFYESTHQGIYSHRHGFTTQSIGGADYWLSLDTTNSWYNTLVSGSYYDYTGNIHKGGYHGEWLEIRLPEDVIVNSFSMRADSTQSKPRSFVILGSVDGVSYDLLGEYTDVNVATTDAGTTFNLDSTLSAYGNLYDYYTVVITRVERVGSNKNVAIRTLKYFSVSKDVSDTIVEVNRHATVMNVTVSNSGSSYLINGVTGPKSLWLLRQHKYIFRYPESHPFRISLTEDGTHNGGGEWLSNITHTVTTGPIQEFEFIPITGYWNKLYYYCSNHSGMGNSISIVMDGKFFDLGNANITYDTSSSPPTLEFEQLREGGASAQESIQVNLSDSFVSAQKDGDNIKLTTISGAQTSVGPFSGGGGGATSTTNYPTSAMTSNALPSPLVAAASTEYSLFSDKLFGTDNLGNIGELNNASFAYEISAWGVYPTDDTILIAADANNGYMLFCRITREGVDVAISSGYVYPWSGSFVSQADLLTHYSNASMNHVVGGGVSTFTKHALFDLAVNNSPAYYAFDEDDSTEWVSHSNTYNTSTGVYVGSENLGALTSTGNADDGEYLKISLDSAVEATTLSLKSVSEYKEPRINMSDYNQCGYEVTASSEHTGPNFKAWQVFDNLLTGNPDYGAAHSGNWVTAAGTYVLSGSEYISSGTQLSASSSTVTGEWLKLKLPDKRKAVGYKLTRQNIADYTRSAKQFRLYGSNDDSTWTEIVGSAQALTTTPLGSYDVAPEATGGTRFDFTTSNAYQYFALVIEKCWGHTFIEGIMEFQLFCQPSEIEEFKLYGSVNNSTWTEIHDQNTSANITSSGTEFTITNPGSYQHYGLVVTKNGGYHNVSLGEMKLGVPDTVDLTNYYTKTELNPLICKARGSVQHTGGSSGTVTLLNEVNINPTVSIPNSLFNLNNFRGYSTTSYHSWMILDFTFATPLTSLEYQVALNDADQNNNAVAVGNIMSLAVYHKSPNGFQVAVVYYEPSATSAQNFGFDFVVF